MKYQLCILRKDEGKDWSVEQSRLRFVVVNSEKSKNYPVNFVCVLPLRLSSSFKTSFEQRFGGEGMDVAKQLLTDASQFSNEEDVKGEIERRLKMLDPKPLRLRICASCRKTFQAGPKKLFRQKFCEDCVKKKLGSQC